MPIVALRPVACGSLLWRMGGVVRASVFVKATFALQRDAIAKLVAPLDVVDADVLGPPQQRAGEARPSASVRLASEAAPYLPSAGVLVSGTAHAPLGLPTPAMAVRVAVRSGDRARLDKMLHVLGDRGRASPVPRAFRSMEMGYERAYGGPGFDDNPVGVGAGIEGPLPNVVDPADATRPAGFGPIAAGWGSRRRLLGVAERPSVAHGIVEVSDELDWRYFHAAPADQQIDFLTGDESVELDGLSPDVPRVRSWLPSARGQARVSLPSGGGALKPIEMSADLLVIDAERGIASIVWRGHVALDGAEVAPTLRVYAGVELPGFPIPWPESRGVSLPALASADAPAIKTGALPAFPGMDDPPTSTTEVTGRIVPSQMAKPALPFAHRPGAPSDPETPALPKLGDDDDEILETRALSVDELSRKMAAQPVAPFALPPPGVRTGPTKANIPGAPWSVDKATAPPEPIEDVTMGVRVPPDVLERVEAAMSTSSPPPRMPSSVPPPRTPTPPPPPPLGAPLVPKREVEAEPAAAAEPDDAGRREVMDRIRRGASLEGVEAPGADLREVDLTGRSLARARLRGAKLSAAKLDRANLTGADLGEADLTGASLEGADLSHANLEGAHLERAKLGGATITDATFVSANAAKAILDGAKGEGASFAGARLDGASLRRVELVSAVFRGAAIGGAIFEGASLPGADLDDTTGEGASFDGARMAKAHGAGASLPKATFRQADLAGSSWERAKLPSASFEGANLRGASLARASCAATSFVDAELSQADLQRITAPSADFRGASLDGADLRKATATDACFVEVAMHRAQVDKANLGRANLSGADLRGSSMRAAILSDANFSLARLEGADLRDADLTNAVLRGSAREGIKLAGATTTGVDLGDEPGA